MSGSTIGGVVGGFIGFWVGGPAGAQIGFALGSAVGGYVDPQVLQGPTLGDIPIQTSQEGVFRPIVYGAPQPFPGNIIMTGPKVRSIKRDRQSKGGPVIESEQVHQTYAIRICEGPAVVLEILRDGKLVYSRTGSRPLDADSAGFASKIVLYEGDETQLPDGTLEGLPSANGGGVGNVPAHRGTAYMVVVRDDLTPTGGRIPNYEFRMASSAVLTQDCMEEGLLAWWPLDDAPTGTALELIAGRNATYQNGASLGSPLNYGSDGSMLMDEIDECATRYGSYGELEVSGLTGWTQTVWCRPSEVMTGNAIVAVNYNNDFDGYHAWGIHLEDMIPFGGYGTSGSPQWVNGSSAIPVGVSCYLALVYRNGTLELYVNTVLVDTLVTGPSNEPGAYIQFGGNIVGSGRFLGQISDVKLYNYALSQTELNDRYVSTSEPFFEAPDAPGSWVSPDGSMHTFCAERATTDVVYLSDIELDIIDRVGLQASQFDVSDITAIPVQGFLIGKPMSAAAALSPLATAYFHDLPEYDLQIHARRRGDASVVSLTDNDFVDAGEDEDIRAQAIELPRKLNVYFSDPSANHAIVPVPAERVSTNVKATGITAIQLPLVLDRDEAKQKADVLLKVIYEESNGRLKRELPAFKHANLIASDPITYDNKRWRINQLDQLEGTIKIDAVRDRISNYTSQATAGPIVNPSDPISSVFGPSVLYPMNLPRLRTQDNVPGVYLAVTGLLEAWPGADIYLSSDGGVTEQLVMTITARATLGELDADIDTGVGVIPVWVFDNRELESISTADLALRRNAFAILDANDIPEIGQFQTADETSTPNHWELTQLHRPLLDTILANHDAGERFVMLDGNIRFLPLDASFIGRTLIFRAVTLGTAPANNLTVSLVFVPYFTGPEVIDYYETEAGDILTTEDDAYLQVEDNA